MLTGKPPFQSTTADEIYRRAREREYDWPKLNTSENFISQETKDLVSDMLQAPEQRPDPDTIVQHPFFTCGWMPLSEEMTPDLRERAPSGDQFLSIGVKAVKSNSYLRNLKKLAMQCDVGPWNPPKKHTSTYREVAAEEKAGLTPAVPLPDGVVYRPFAEWLKEQSQLIVDDDDEFEGSSVTVQPKPIEQVHVPASRPPTQSFAAQQRARPGPSSQPIRAGRTRQPSGQSSKAATESIPSSAVPIPTRTKSRKVETRISEEVADVEGRLAIDLMNHLPKPHAAKKPREVGPIDLTIEKPRSMFNPRERLELLSSTKPDRVLEGLRRLQAELERALNSRSMALESERTVPHPTIVVKWVDYTNKFGLGYILSTGSVGCIFRRTPLDSAEANKGYLPPACIIVKDAERHLQRREDPTYADRRQMVPMSGPSIEFYENRGEEGIFRSKVSPRNYNNVSAESDTAKLAPGVDEWDQRKRDKITLWKKFANYMITFSKDPDDAITAAAAAEDKQTDSVAAGNVITFYQRWGDVGCWGFCDGHFQVRFNRLVFVYDLLTSRSSTFQITQRLFSQPMVSGAIFTISHCKPLESFLPKALYPHRPSTNGDTFLTPFKLSSTSSSNPLAHPSLQPANAQRSTP